MFLREPYPVDSTALADTRLLFVPATAVDRVLDEDPMMARDHAGLDGQAAAVKVQDIAMLSLQSATQRIVAFVLGAAGSPGPSRPPWNCPPSSRCWPPGWA